MCFVSNQFPWLFLLYRKVCSTDDGYSGTNFDKASFKSRLSDIENGKINCVITKYLSRLGRNYLESGAYIEIFFSEHNVRYIALNDCRKLSRADY